MSLTQVSYCLLKLICQGVCVSVCVLTLVYPMASIGSVPQQGSQAAPLTTTNKIAAIKFRQVNNK